jgi:dihydrofolate synthase/folylpolyglutamate synthase
LYVTPHLHTFRERIQLNLAPISEGDFAELVEAGQVAVVEAEHSHPELGGVTAFELVTALALRAFADAGVDIAVVEVGLGGRLDATNVVVPRVAAITAVSLDHTAILGDTLEQIAGEKAGVIKPGRPVVVGPQQPAALAAIAEIAEQRGSQLLQAGVDWRTSGTWRSARFDGPWGALEDVRLTLPGNHQVENAGTALMSAWLLDPSLLSDEDRVAAALGAVRWPARFEVAADAPTVIIDGAHNVDSMERLVETVREVYAHRPVIVVLGTSRDKDVEGMLRTLAPVAKQIFAVQSANPRAWEAAQIGAMARSQQIPTAEFSRVAEAVAAARATAGLTGVVVVTGSLYVAAEARVVLGLAQTSSLEHRLLYG